LAIKVAEVDVQTRSARKWVGFKRTHVASPVLGFITLSPQVLIPDWCQLVSSGQSWREIQHINSHFIPSIDHKAPS
jgi:hypothetical protein